MPGMSTTMTRPGLRLAILAATTALVLLAAGALADPRPTYAVVTDESIEAQILSLVNTARANRGLAPLRMGPKLQDFAGSRAAYMARTGVLKHPTCLACMMRNWGITFTNYGETIAWTYAPWGSKAAASIVNIWRNSPPHWGLLMSPKYSRVGIGVALRSNGATYAAAVLAN